MKAFLIAVILLIAIAGCGGKKTTGPDSVRGPQYLLSSTPQNVLINLQLSYSGRDTTEYKTLYDDNYVGTSTDQLDGSALNFTKSDEVGHVSALARHTSITNVSLTLPPSLLRFTDGVDPPGWATVQFAPGVGFNVEINDTPSSLYMTSNTTNEFKFIPTTPAAGSPTDTTWKIVRWTETH